MLSGSCSATAWMTSPFIAFQRVAAAGRAEQEQVGAVGHGHVEDGVGDVAGDAVEEPQRDAGLLRLARGAVEEAAGLRRPRRAWARVGPIGVTARWRMKRSCSSAWRFLHSLSAKSMSRGCPGWRP